MMCKKSSSGSLSKSVIFSLIAGVGKIHLIFSSTHMVTNNKNEETFSTHMFAHRTPSSHSIIHAILQLTNLSNYVPFDSVKHRFHPYLADETCTIWQSGNVQICTLYIVYLLTGGGGGIQALVACCRLMEKYTLYNINHHHVSPNANKYCLHSVTKDL